MRILVCGNGPSLLKQLKNRSLDSYDLVVRVNGWRDIPGYDNRCDAWTFAPFHDWVFHDPEIGYEHNKHCQLWVPFPGQVRRVQELTGRSPDRAVTGRELNDFRRLNRFSQPASTGIMAIYLAIRDTKKSEVHIAGFDFYAPGRLYYYSPPDEEFDGDMSHTIHDAGESRRYIDTLIEANRISILKAEEDTNV